ncbi:hypothetical protein PIB30_112232, partial [Stylosanthes scabra]|nr:hypothetical protein [Stylosanthes scabra]
MAKKKSCQNVRNPRVLSPAERELYGWVDAEVFTQSSVLAPEDLPEFRRRWGWLETWLPRGTLFWRRLDLPTGCPFRRLR